ncbi:MAG: rhomboid family intramembrane serine protease [Spirochaetaceae bacterium]|nr:rhomboid family intramembrane serine protease [Spirochaetaceae bacterium]
MKLKYNAPVTLTFALICVIILLLKYLFFPEIVSQYFMVPAHAHFDIKNPFAYPYLVSHVFGHSDWNHLLSNMSFILLLGPILEENYGSFMIAIMMFTTALVTGVLNVCFSVQPLIGSSGIAFTMILLSSFTNTTRNEIPLSFIVILLLFLLKDIIQIFETDNIAHFAHLVGGISGSLFGYFMPKPLRSSNNRSGS